MIVRELVTLLSFKKGDEAPLHAYGESLKHLARLAAEFFAIGAAIEIVRKITEISDEWATVAGRVSNVVEGLDEQHRVLDALQAQAEKTGQAYEGVGSLFAQITMTGSSLGYTTDQVLGLTSAISQLVTLGGGTAAAGKRGMVQIEEMFSVGVVQMQHLRALMIDIPGAVDVLSASLKGGKKEFMDMVHDGTMTSKMLGDMFLKSGDEIERRFARMPLTFARAFTTARNYFGRLITDIGEGTDIWVTLAQAIIDGSRGIVNAFRWVERATGSWTNALRLAGIIFISLFGPRALAMVARMVRALWGLVTVTSVLRGAWFLASVAILGAFEDIYGWWQGKDSITEEIIGPRSKWQATIDAWKNYFLGILDQLTEAINRLGTALGLPGYHEKSLEKRLGDPGSPAEDDRLERMRQYDATHDWLGRPITQPTSPQPVPMDVPASRPIPMNAPAVRPVPTDAPLPSSGGDQSSIRGDLQQIVQWFSKQLDALAEQPTRMPLVPSLGSLVPPSAMVPPNVTNTTNNDVRAPISVTVNSASDTPQAIGAAAGEGARKGALEGWARTLGLAAPQTEYGLAY